MKKFTKLLMLFVLCLVGMQGNAQNVSISPTSGKLVAALTYSGEQGFQRGWSSLWRHEQLPLTLTVSDENTLTVGGEIANPADNIVEYERNSTIGNKLVLAGGQSPDLYMVLSLPKGYSIRGYKIVLLNNLNGRTVSELTSTAQNKTLYETHSDFDYSNAYTQTPTMGSTNSDTQEFVIERHDQTDQGLGNQLYFRVNHSSANYFLLTIKSFMVYFTAEGTFDVDVTPDHVGPATSCFAVPFKTSKTDIGAVTSRTKNNRTFYAYDYRNVQDLEANTYIYQQDAIENGVPTDVATNKTIYPVQVGNNTLFALGNNTYYVEPPVEITNQGGNTGPIGYRVVGAVFNCLWGSHTDAVNETNTYHYISYTKSNGEKVYLNAQGKFVTTKTTWVSDNNGVHSGNAYLCLARNNVGTWYNPNYQYSLSIGSVNSNRKVQLYNNSLRAQYGLLDDDWRYLQGTESASATPSFTTGSSNLAVWETVTETIELVHEFNPGSYKLTVYGKTGAETDIAWEKTVSGSGDIETKDMGSYNNDAVKFKIENLEEGKQALVSVTLLLQALDPYIDEMEIVCHDPNDQLTLSQPFNADDFTVSGGKFVFYIPQEYINTDLEFTFKDLYSHYGDETYYDGTGTHNGRYSFVTSNYFRPIDGSNNGGLYDSNYNCNAPYNNKVFTSTAGNIRFKFNNAEDLSNTSGQTVTQYLEEYPFSVANYLGSSDPDGGTITGDTIHCTMNATSAKSKVFYVFTADETRYNIAPSTAWQHRYYAYYRMDIDLQAKTYTPALDWEKIYDKTCYYKNDEFPMGDDGDTPAGGVNTDSMWGLKLAAKDGNTVVKDGYLTYKEIDDAITAALGTSDTVPNNKSQILYVDGSNLYSMINSANVTLQTLKTGMAENALVFLPENNTSNLDNVVSKTSSGSYVAGKDIVLKDRYPFFTPYDIQVESPNKAIYTRTVTRDIYGKDLLASVILPYSLTISEGIHTNPDNSTIKLTKMESTNLSLEVQEKNDYYGQALFTNVEGDATEANKPYMVVAENQGTNSFVAAQTGAKVLATADMKKRAVGGGEYKYLYMGEEVSGNADIPGDGITLTAEGGYTGHIYDRAHSEAIFYFAENKFYNLYRMKPYKRYLYTYPFRGVYSFAGTISNNVRSMNGFDIMFDEGLWNTNGIVEMTSSKVPDMAVRTGKGFIQISSTKDQTVSVLSLNGTTFNKVTMNAGDSKTISLPAGVYVVNNVKITVK